MLRLAILTARLRRVPLPRLEDIGAVVMAAPNPWGHTFERFLPPLEMNEDTDEPRRH